MLGTLYALLSAATFAFNTASARRGMISGSVFQALAITVPIAIPLFAVMALATGHLWRLGDFRPSALFALAAAGIVHFVWGRYCGYRSVKAMGANLSAPLQNANLVVALGLAILLLGETLTPLKIFGLVLILVGPMIALPHRAPKRGKDSGSRPAPEAEAGAPSVPDRPEAARTPASPPFRPKMAEGIFWALMSATGYGVSPVLVRFALEDMADASMAGGLVSAIAASLFFLLFLIPRGRVAHVRAMDRDNARWFVVSGVFVFLAQMFRYLALAIAPVTVVTPIQRLSTIFRILFSTMLNREHEVLSLALVIGTVISIIGAIALTLSVDLVVAHLPIPRAALDWQWP